MKDSFRILLVDDNPDDRLLIKRELLKAFGESTLQLHAIVDQPSFEAALESGDFDLVITDYHLKWSDGLEVLRALKARYPHRPVIMFTGTGNEEIAVEAMRAGLDDYILKSTKHFQRLRGTIEALLRRAESLTRAEQLEHRLQSLLERLNVGVFRSTPGGQLLEANPACLRILGLDSLEEARQINLVHFYPDAKEREALLKQLFEAGRLSEREIHLRRRDGSEIWVAVTEVLNRAGEEVYIEGIMEDVTPRKLAELALKDSEERYRRLVEHSPMAIVVHTDGKLVFVNPAAVKLVGARSADELIGRPVVQFAHPEDVELMRARVRRVLESGEAVEPAHERIVRLDGTILNVEVTGIPIFYQGKPSVQVVIRDVTQQLRMEEELRRREAQFRHLIENASDIIAIVTPNGEIRYGSPSIQTILGYDEEDIHSENVFDLLHPEDVKEVTRHFSELLAEPGCVSPYMRFRLRTKEGKWRLLEAVAKNLLHDSSIGGIVVNARDVTERQILEEQLFQSQKMEAIGRLAGGVAHDFNNLLTAIRGYSELILHALRPEDPIYEDVKEIQRATERAGALTRQLLAFSRKQLMKPQVLNPNRIIEDMYKLLKRLIGEHIELMMRLDEQIGHVKVDPVQLEQVILNLVVNARDAMPAGGRLTIETRNVELDELYAASHEEAAAGSYVLISITDTGAGMEAEVRERAFEPFFTTKERGKGTGLGLATVYGIIKQSGGFIYLYSEPGMGTTFKVYLPRVAEGVAVEEEKIVTQADLRGDETVLVVEDEPLLLDLVRRVLQNYGYHVLGAQNADEAIAASRSHSGPIHLLLTDVILPRLNGRQLAERITSLRPDIRVLYMSGYTDDAVLDRKILERQSEFIAKPFAAEELVRKIRRILQNH